MIAKLEQNFVVGENQMVNKFAQDALLIKNLKIEFLEKGKRTEYLQKRGNSHKKDQTIQSSKSSETSTVGESKYLMNVNVDLENELLKKDELIENFTGKC
ncbi:hypothetical protein HHI36_018384 [Cryptolaemus montrouzieri]|uniref:Uncharacterized protein n=1 Tax=Cryptolaemus montrouzieri TaxID=559131 RepID=A0ABD2NZT4_9CUCU